MSLRRTAARPEAYVPRRPGALRRRSQAALFFFLLLVLASVADAQEGDTFLASPGKFECGSRASASFIDLKVALKSDAFALLDARPSAIPANASKKTFGPFDEKRFGFTSVEFYQFLTGAQEEGSMATETDIHFYLRIVRSQGENWYGNEALVDKADGPSPPQPDDDADQSDTAPKAPVDPNAAIDIAAPDPALPLFQLSYGSRWMGANAGGGTGNVLIVDLRSSPPRVLEQMQCVWGEGGGVCTAPDSGYGVKTSLSCEWRKEVSDYGCSERDDNTTGWGERFTDRQYLLLSGADTFQLPADAPGSLELFADRVTPQKAAGQSVLLPDVGEATVLYSVLQQQHDLYVFGARGTSDSLDARFFLAERPFEDRPPVSLELQPSAASTLRPVTYPEADLARQKAAAPPQPRVTARTGGQSLSFHTRKLYGDDDFFVLEVVVKEGTSHSLYWVGVDQRSSPIVADLYRVATDAPLYGGCMTFRQEESAASYRLLPGRSFRALLDTEPEHLENVTDENNPPSLAQNNNADPSEPPPQPCTVRLTWDRAKGFVRGENPVCRAAGPRAISIADDGKLSTVPIAPAPKDPQ